ncbi:MAG: hypothetical protein GC157_10760 [Frankiales bacterium]|nr:hypothetical protein [Frankiales bacterium]
MSGEHGATGIPLSERATTVPGLGWPRGVAPMPPAGRPGGLGWPVASATVPGPFQRGTSNDEESA